MEEHGVSPHSTQASQPHEMSKLYGKKIVRIRRRRQTFMHGFPRGRPPRWCADETPRNTASCSGQDSWSTSARGWKWNGTCAGGSAQHAPCHLVTDSSSCQTPPAIRTREAGTAPPPHSRQPALNCRARVHPSPDHSRSGRATPTPPGAIYLSLVGTRPAAVNNERPAARRLSHQRPRQRTRGQPHTHTRLAEVVTG